MTPNETPLGQNLPAPKPARAQSNKPTSPTGQFKRNLGLMADWYRAQDSGPERGLNVVAEIVLRDVAAALDAALAGKDWQPPT